jgi:hypothetical protein
MIPAQINGEFTSLGELSGLFFETGFYTSLIYLGASLIGGAWGSSSLLTGFRLLFSFDSRWLKAGYFSFGLVFLAGIFMLTYAGVSTAKDFAIEGEMSKEMSTYAGDSLNLVVSNEMHLQAFTEKKLNLSANGFEMNRNPDENFILAENGRLYVSGISIKYEASLDSLYHVKVLKRANGSSYLKANIRAAQIKFPCTLNNRNLEIASGFSYPASDRMRDQEVELVIAVPRGKTVLWKDQVVYPYVTEFSTDESSNRAYVHGDGHYSAW